MLRLILRMRKVGGGRRVRVSINGLKPLVKETIVEFDTGEESRITLEYERLENHCSICLLLSHSNEHCGIRS